MQFCNPEAPVDLGIWKAIRRIEHRALCPECLKQSSDKADAMFEHIPVNLIDIYESEEDMQDVIRISSHSFQQELKDETLPPAEEFFDDNQELKVEILDKKIGLDQGDYSDCPKQWRVKLDELLENFKD